MKEEIVKWFSKKKYPCKKNKGEHEWGKPELLYDTPDVRYSYKTEHGILKTSEPENTRFCKKYKLLEANVSVVTETRCIHCGKKVTSFLRDKIK
jgi:hypothetical protein